MFPHKPVGIRIYVSAALTIHKGKGELSYRRFEWSPVSVSSFQQSVIGARFSVCVLTIDRLQSGTSACLAVPPSAASSSSLIRWNRQKLRTVMRTIAPASAGHSSEKLD